MLPSQIFIVKKKKLPTKDSSSFRKNKPGQEAHPINQDTIDSTKNNLKFEVCFANKSILRQFELLPEPKHTSPQERNSLRTPRKSMQSKYKLIQKKLKNLKLQYYVVDRQPQLSSDTQNTFTPNLMTVKDLMQQVILNQ